MQIHPGLPHFFAEDVFIFETLFNAAEPASQTPAEGQALANAMRAAVGENMPAPPDGVADLPVSLPDAVSDTPADLGNADLGFLVVDWAPAPILNNDGPHGGGPGGGGGGPGGGGGGGPGGGNGGGGDSGGTLYYSDNGAGSTAETYDTAGFDIVISYEGKGWTADLMAAFENAADYLTSIITNDWGIGSDTFITDGSFEWDDLWIQAEIGRIDGSGGGLAQAGPVGFWPELGMPALSTVKIDKFDIDTMLADLDFYQDIVMHEIFHTLGFGSLWDEPNLFNGGYGKDLLNASGDYIGAAGMAAYELEYDVAFGTPVPVEDGGGAGTVGGHWEETALGAELMTGFIDQNVDSYLSYTSVMSLEDLGYNVAYADWTYDAYDSLNAIA